MATTDELKKKDGSTVQPGAARPTKGLFPYNQPEADIYGGLGKPASAPENQPGPRGMLGNLPVPAAPVGNPNQIPTSGYSAAPSVPSAAPQAAQPLDAQAQADRATASSLMSGIGDMNRRAGAAIADVATLIPRGLAGAYDTAVVRPMRAAGMNAGFISPMLAPDGANPASQTPFYDKIREQDALAAAPKPAATQPAPQAAMAAGASSNPAAPVQANPAVAPSVAPGAPTQPTALQAMAAPAPGAVTRVGNSYSGTNVSGDISINGKAPSGGVITAQDNQAAENLARRSGQTSGFGASGPLQGGGTVSSMDTSAGYASDLKQLADIERAKEDAAFNQPMSKSKRSALLAKRGQDATATNQTAAQKLAENRFGLDSANAELENKAKNMTLTAQTALVNAKTPEEKQSAMAMLAGLSGKESAQKAQYAYAPGGQMVDPVTGQTVTQPGVIFNQYTGETAQPGQKQALPKGMVKQVGTSNGKPVYEDANGTRHQ